MNTFTTLSTRQRLLFKSLFVLLILEFLSAIMLGIIFFPSDLLSETSHQIKLFGQLFEYLVVSIIGAAFLMCLLFPSKKSTPITKFPASPSTLYRPTFSIQRPQYDPMNDTTNPASPSYYGRFSRRV